MAPRVLKTRAMSTPNTQSSNTQSSSHPPSSSCSPQASQYQRPHHPTPSQQQHQQHPSDTSHSHWLSRTPTSRPSTAPGLMIRTATATTQESRFRFSVNTSQQAAEGGEDIPHGTPPLSIRKRATYPPPNASGAGPEKIGFGQRVGAGYGYSHDGRENSSERSFPIFYIGSIILGIVGTLFFFSKGNRMLTISTSPPRS